MKLEKFIIEREDIIIAIESPERATQHSKENEEKSENKTEMK